YAILTLCRLCFNATSPTGPYTLSLHDALPICTARPEMGGRRRGAQAARPRAAAKRAAPRVALPQSRDDPGQAAGAGAEDQREPRSEEHTSELQSRENLVCRLLLEKKKKHRMR